MSLTDDRITWNKEDKDEYFYYEHDAIQDFIYNAIVPLLENLTANKR